MKADEAVTEILRINPKYSLDVTINMGHFKSKADLNNLLEALREAGVPERSPE
jgi:hypothetical protein